MGIRPLIFLFQCLDLTVLAMFWCFLNIFIFRICICRTWMRLGRWQNSDMHAHWVINPWREWNSFFIVHINRTKSTYRLDICCHIYCTYMRYSFGTTMDMDEERCDTNKVMLWLASLTCIINDSRSCMFFMCLSQSTIAYSCCVLLTFSMLLQCGVLL